VFWVRRTGWHEGLWPEERRGPLPRVRGERAGEDRGLWGGGKPLGPLVGARVSA